MRRFPEQSAGRPLRVPHIGWNEVRWSGDHPLLAGLPERDTYYFVHAYRALPDDPSVQVGSCDYGGPFAAAVARANVFAVQFHPEKSSRPGLALLANFVRTCTAAVETR